MDTFAEFESLLNEPGKLPSSSNDFFDDPSSDLFDIPVDAERYGDPTGRSLCIIC
jgi:hypothetical protein